MVVPIYLAEVSPTKIRGTVVAVNNLAITFGQFFAIIITIILGSDWRMMLGLAATPSVI
jgi:SP family myo-inositol transporter-like MFS transporter 13